MRKKRRDFQNAKHVNLISLQTNLREHIAQQINCIQEDGLVRIEHCILPEYGQGAIIELHFGGVVISMSKFVLNSDYLIYNQSKKNKVQLSFLLSGEKIISVNNGDIEMPYEGSESYMAYIKTYKGYNRISGNKLFKEIKIVLAKSFLLKHEIPDTVSFKALTDCGLIIPITSDLLSILFDLETKDIHGVSRRIYLEAKVLEILAIQIDNYKKADSNKFELKTQKLIKKLYSVKQFLKDNLDKNYSIHELSEEIGLNENLLKNEFKRVFELTLNQYFVNEKMTKAKYLLEHTELPIYHIAENVGYKNATHFSAAFKRFYNETPKVCRIKM